MSSLIMAEANLTKLKCDLTTCDFLDNMCLNHIDYMPGFFEPDCPGNALGILLEIFVFLYAMLGLAIVCDDYLCVALERLCDVFMIREDVAGATFMAFGSAAPEIIVNAVSTIKQAKAKSGDASAVDATNTGVGAILGSGMIAFLVIPGACALSAEDGIQLLLKRRPLLRDVGAYATALLLLCIFFHDGKIVLYESMTLVGFYIIYVMVVVFAPKIRREYRHRILKKPKKKRKSFVNKKTSVVDESLTRNMDEPLLTGGAPESEEGNLDKASYGSTKPRVTFSDGLEEGGVSVTILGDNDSSENAGLNLNGGDADGEQLGIVGRIITILSKPLQAAFELTCFPCEEGSKYENYYPVTFAIAFVWVSFFSFIIGTCVRIKMFLYPLFNFYIFWRC